ncbi:MAG: DUF1206 domain-containing protein [Cryobacterium sp.]
MTPDSASDVARAAKRSTSLQMLARLGFLVNGLLHILIAALAIAIAVGDSAGTADQSGALGHLAGTPGGVVILWAIVVGLVALGVWLVLSAFLLRGAHPTRRWSHRIGDLGKATAYFAFGGTAATFAVGRTTSSGGSARDVTATLLAAPGGVVVLVLGGFAVLAVAGYFVYKGAVRKFTNDIAVPSGLAGQVIIGIGIVGYIAKGIALGVVAVLILLAAFTRDASKSTGLDGALKSLAALPYGGVILGTVGVGLITYGIYCFARAGRARF